MKLFQAIMTEEQLRAAYEVDAKNILISYYFLVPAGNYRNKQKLRWIMRDSLFFLDSGAFTAHSKGVNISLIDYMRFIEENLPMIDMYTGLDDIASWKQTLKNQEIMEKQGFHPLFTFHHGEPMEILRDAIQKYDYIALGGIVGRPKKEKLIFLDKIFNLIAKHRLIKTHIFGSHDRQLLIRYPFYSADASSDSMNAAMAMYRDSNGSARKIISEPRNRDIKHYEALKIYYGNGLSGTTKQLSRLKNFIRHKKQIEFEITRIWEERGVNWTSK